MTAFAARTWRQPNWNCGIFGTARRNFAARRDVGPPREQKACGKSRRSRRLRLARLLPSKAVEDLVFPAAVLSIVLVLAIGPNAAVLCAVWCHPAETKSAACQHQGGTTSALVTGEDSCRTIPAAATAFVREEAKPGWQSDGTLQSVPVLPFRFAPPPADTNVTNNASTSLALGSSPRLIALRI
jgi:hypothetical protein